MKTFGYVMFIGLMLAELVLCAIFSDAILKLQVWQIALLGLAAFRTGRALSYNAVFSWLRAPFCRVEQDSSGAGDSIAPKSDKDDLRYVIGDLLCCPICTASQAASSLLLLNALVPSLGLVAIYALGAAGIAEGVHWFAEKMEWEGRYARERAGSEWLAKNSGTMEASGLYMRLPESEFRPRRNRATDYATTEGRHAR